MDFPQTISEWILQALAMGLTALLIPNLRITSIFGAFTSILGLALINATVWDAALFMKVPDSISTQALMLFLANGVLFFIVVKLLPGIEIKGLGAAVMAPVVFSLSSVVITEVGKDVDWAEVGKNLMHKSSELRAYIKDSTEAEADQPPSEIKLPESVDNVVEGARSINRAAGIINDLLPEDEAAADREGLDRVINEGGTL